MANLIDLRRRVRSVKNMQQITRAMKFVSAAKLRRAQERIFAARPFANRMLAVLNSLATRVGTDEHPLLAERDFERVMLIVITGDKGMCGGFNSNIIKSATRFIEDEAGDTLSLTVVGRKARDWAKREGRPVQHEYVGIMTQVDFEYAREVATNVVDYYSDSDLDAVYLVYNEFKSVISQNVVLEQLLPIRRLEFAEAEQGSADMDYVYEQPAEQILDELLPRHVQTQVFRAMLESEAAEHGARMTAMDAATRNAKDVIATLTQHINRVRQAGITTEIIEIVSGANALHEARSE